MSRVEIQKQPGGIVKQKKMCYVMLFMFAIVPLQIKAQDSGADQKHKAEAAALANDKVKSETASKATGPSVQARMQIVFSEYEGDKKTKSLPYTLISAAPDWEWAKLRIGSRVPIDTGKDGAISYIDVGTNIDARVERIVDNRIEFVVNLERSWVEKDAYTTAEGTLTKQPIIRQFKSNLKLLLRDGQTTETTVATDPLSGKVIKVEIGLNILR